MNKLTLELIIWTFILILAQALVFNHVNVLGVAVPFVFIYTLIKLPLAISKEWGFTIGFIIGIVVDIFSNTLGMNALACTLLMALRQPIIRLYIPRDNDLSNPMPGIQSLGLITFTKFVLTVSLLYTTLIFFIESFSTLGLVNVIIRISSSTIITTSIIVGIDSLTSRKREKRL